MMFLILILILILLVAFFHYLQGLFSGIISAVLTVIAALVAVSYHEPIVESLLGGKMANTAHGLVLLMTFAVIYLVGRVMFDSMVPGNVRVPAIVDKLGGAATGVVAGLFAGGVVALAAQEMPFYPEIWGYTRYEVDSTEVTIPRSGGTKSVDRPMIDAATFGDFADARQNNKERALIVPVDDLLLATVARMSEGGSMAGRQPLSRVHPDWLTELFAQRGGIEPGAKRVAINNDKAEQVTFGDAFALEPPNPENPDAGRTILREAEFPNVRTRQQAPSFKSRPKYKFFVIRVFFDTNAADKDRIIRFSPGSVRLVTRGTPEGGEGMDWTNYFPVGTLDEGRILYRSRPDDFLFINDAGPPDGVDKGVDLVFHLDPAGFVDSKTQKMTDGTFLEVKRLARIDLSGKPVKPEVVPDLKGQIRVLRKPGALPVVKDGATAGGGSSTPAPAPAPAPAAATPLAQKLVGTWETVTAAGTGTMTFTDTQMTVAERNALGGGGGTQGTWKATGSSGNTLNIRADLKDPKGAPVGLDIAVTFDGDDRITVVIPGRPSQTLNRKNPGSAGTAVTPPAPAPTPAPAPAPKPEDTFTLEVTEARPYRKFYSGIGLPKDAANSKPVPTPGGTGTLTLEAGKISVLDLKPVDTTPLRSGTTSVSDLYVPDGQSMVQVQADPSHAPTSDPWAWLAKSGTLTVVDAAGTRHPVCGVWVALDDAGTTKIAGRYDAPGKKATLADMKLTGKPTQITFAFLVPAGTQVKEVRMGDTLLKGDLDVTAP